MSVAATGEAAEAGREGQAVVLIPSLGERTDQSADAVARRIRTALQRAAADPTPSYDVDPQARHERYGLQLEHSTAVHTVRRVAGNTPEPLIDVYDMSYAVDQTSRFEKGSTLGRSLRVLFVVGFSFVPLLAAFSKKHPGKRKTAKAQMLIGVLILLGLTAYAGLVLWGLGDTVWRFVHANGHVGGVQSTQPVMGWAQITALVLAALGLASPASLKQAFSAAAIDYLGVISYLLDGTGRDQRVGQLSDLLAHIGTKRYKTVHVMGYSFGSIIAFDAFFPPDDEPAPAFAMCTLVTIGCPYDLIRVYWPEYFRNRRRRDNAPTRWLNVYSPMDVMSSNFNNDDDQTAKLDAELAEGLPVPVENLRYSTCMPGGKLTVPKATMLLGLRSHSMYWVRDNYEGDAGCFGLIVAELWPPGSL